jgi:PAS domain S-box-containing protein
MYHTEREWAIGEIEALNSAAETFGAAIQQKQTKESLWQSEEKYRTILENIEDGYYEVDINGNFTFFNDSLCRMLGYSRDEMMGMGNQQYTDEENRKKLFEAFNKVFRTGEPIKGFDWEIITKDGRKRSGEVSISLIKDLKGQPIGFRGIARDVTERKQAEKEIKQTLSLLNATLESTADGILVVDREGKIESFNQRFVQMWHITESIIASRDDDQALAFVLNQLKYPEDFLSKVKELYGQPLAESFDLLEFKDGRTFERYSKAQQIGEQIVGRVWSFRDITERKHAEEFLAQSEERYRTLVEESFDGIWIQKGFKINFANRRLYEMLGYEEGELEGIDHWLVYHPDFQAITRERAKARMLGESVPSTYEVKFLRKDGSSFWGEINAKVLNFLGEPGIQVWARDISERKQAEETLCAERERFRSLSENSPFGMVMIDKDGVFKYINPKFKELFGYDLNDVPDGKTWFRKAYPDPNYRHHVIGTWIKDLKSIKPGEKRSEIFTVKCKDGTERIIHFIPVPLETGENLTACEDITDRKKAEEMLIRSEERFNQVAESAGEWIWEINADGLYTYVNPVVEKILGFKPEEIVGKKYFYDFFTPEVREELKKAAFQAFAKKEPFIKFLNPNVNKIGNIVFLETTGTPIINNNGTLLGYRGVDTDVTERKRAEEALKESEGKYRHLVEESFDGIYIHNGFNIIFANRQFQEMLGYKADELEVMDHWLVFHPDYQDLTRQRAQARLRGEKVPPPQYEIKLQRKDGSSCDAELNARRILLGNKPVIQVCVKDITQHKEAEREMKALEEQFRQSQKMEAIGGLAGGIAHDFNNLLTVIKGYAELSCLGLDRSDPLRGNIEEILKASERATNLTRQLLAFGRRQILEFKVINLNTLLKDLDKMLHRILGEDIDLVYHLAEDIGKVKTDPGQIEQVVLNLAVNARDAMPSGGKLTIQTSNVELDEAYARIHMGTSPGHYVMLSVSDSGAGMAPEVRERIFEPFFTTKEKGKGTGLGLSTVYGIVKQSGGNINVYSEPGLGTTFKIYLPRVEEEEDPLQWKNLDISLSTGNETILLTEDEQSVRELAARILRDRGYQIYEAPDGREALAIVQGHPERKFHLLLTDVVMPGMSGKELADRLKLSIPDIKVLFISGYTDNAIVHHGVLDKGVNFIQKPFTPDSLARKIREVLDRS